MTETNESNNAVQRIQFGDEISPVKSVDENAIAYTSVLHSSRVSEKVSYADLEEQAIAIADEDLNGKKKQVWMTLMYDSSRLMPQGDLLWLDARMARLPIYWSNLWRYWDFASKALGNQTILSANSSAALSTSILQPLQVNQAMRTS